MATQPIALGPDPASLTCPHCHARVTTTMKAAANTKTHIIALILCVCLKKILIMEPWLCSYDNFQPSKLFRMSKKTFIDLAAMVGKNDEKKYSQDRIQVDIIQCIPCVCIPYCCDSCQTLQHYCPNCQAYLGSYAN
ncbi:unnamed protein product [Acanthoscelides obtectus]|uniref:LITAF domain-containing protein n=1 Tax=Acanthoscelides obtectus TaxID=200917 RepID=A0A9P0L172_ACAOB|nr:unnamed protein product [Acanthoscelides obtectus]CAK1650953.1 hypothetical protein AOBTE_LOCUS16988 [Acanthoscelides obtectus]